MKRYNYFWLLIGINVLLVVVLVGLLTNWWARESYPRLVPWEFVTEPSETDTTMTINALSYACNLDTGGNTYVTETFDRVDVYETPDTVTIETWLGPPESKSGFWQGCHPAQGWGFTVHVELDTPLGTRTLIDPGCEMDRYTNWSACEKFDPPVPEFWLQPREY